jgi:DNA phosphorothioation-associated putative methyltransferase
MNATTSSSYENKIGKLVAGYRYAHVSAITELPSDFRTLIKEAADLAQLEAGTDFNVVKIQTLRDDLSLLSYADFFDSAFPTLARSWRISVERGTVVYRSYIDSRNPPILHRKELLLAASHPRLAEYRSLTEAAEALGLFEDTKRIGFKEHWYQLITERGYTFNGNEFLPIGNDEFTPPQTQGDVDNHIRRHLTALWRSNYSAPVQALLRHNLVNERTTFFDYGCGRGDDVHALRQSGIDATGWDPFYACDAERRLADAVNLGFVINVIEDIGERTEALQNAFSLTQGVLAVAAMLTSQIPPDGKVYGDGYISSRNTFQKYFSQSQLRDFIEHSLDTTAIAAGTGVFLIFRDKELEQKFLAARYRRARVPQTRAWDRVRPTRAPQVRVDRVAQLIGENRQHLDHLWSCFLELGRTPHRDEIDADNLRALESGVGSLTKALKLTLAYYPNQDFIRAAEATKADLSVWGALETFQKRKPYRHLATKIRNDIKHFFGDYPSYQSHSQALLFQIGNLEAIERSCIQAYENGFGWLEPEHSLQLHSTLLERLPPLLRVYVGCATVLCGDISEFDLIKIHIRSGKVTLMKFEGFEHNVLPRLTQRVKVKLRDQDIEIFTYGQAYPPPLLFHKSRYINEEFPGYAEQVEFETELERLGLHNLTGYGPPEVEFFNALAAARWGIEGNRLKRSLSNPELSDLCGRYFSYHQLIECGETQQRSGFANFPKEPDSYTALYELASKVLDPVIDYFGMITLTYGFCSPQLGKMIRARIAPKLDQHAAHEKNRNGCFVCERLGAACDFIVDDEDMEDVAEWVFRNTPVDRLYFYGKERPIHVSNSETPARQFVDMKKTDSGKQVPRVRKIKH